MTSQPTFLLELMSPQHGDVVTADVFAYLDTAVEKAVQHVLGANVGPMHSHVTTDGEAFEGMSLFDDKGNMLACVTCYHLERDHERATLPQVRRACENLAQFQTVLNELINP